MAACSTPGEAMHTPRQQRGFTYLGLMAAIVILGILLTLAGRVWSFSERRDKEAQLLWAGDQYRLSIGRYYTFTHHYPLSLQDLLLDDTTPVPRRFLRQLYPDPISGQADWALILDPTSNGIMGIASKSNLAPIKRRNFPDLDVGFADTDCYCDWKFVYIPANRFYHGYTAPVAPGLAPTPSLSPGAGFAPGAPAPVGLGQYTPTPAPAPACDPSVDGCVPPPSPQPPRTPPRIPPPNTPPGMPPHWP
jgi:type II secretory pathway pseudopilin PulG